MVLFFLEMRILSPNIHTITISSSVLDRKKGLFSKATFRSMSHGLNKTEFVSGWVQSPKGRGTWEILYSNMFTLGLCVFTAIHLNVGPSGRTEFQYWLHKCKWVLITVFFPELTLYMAGKQWFTANRLRKKLNKHHQVHFMPTNSSERNLESNPSQDRPDPSIEAVGI